MIVQNSIIIINQFLTLVLASLSTPSSTRVRTVSSLPYILAEWRAVCPCYNNNEEMRHKNKIMVKMMIVTIMIIIVMTITAIDSHDDADSTMLYNICM